MENLGDLFDYAFHNKCEISVKKEQDRIRITIKPNEWSTKLPKVEIGISDAHHTPLTHFRKMIETGVLKLKDLV